MRNSVLALALGLVLATPALANPPGRFVNLDRPGALESIARDDPAHYAKIVKVLDAARVKPCETLPGFLRTQVDIDRVDCASHMFLTSYPARIHLTFRIDGTNYTSNVAQPGLAGRLVPALADVRRSGR